jgi:hypothetical protein
MLEILEKPFFSGKFEKINEISQLDKILSSKLDLFFKFAARKFILNMSCGRIRPSYKTNFYKLKP